ncbi:hypothetical protein HHK36_028662 [Tetracentron sinense]|uniref:C2H2-type domain-containing protein n=1 Tax=Tetracentron sinense TaxID=13715 RepID=A0A834YHS8_TETSI|nr:hypothetical protein HHK36_028662 [Tetracentron sinense]
MAVVVDQTPSLKHFCRICKKGFGCGRALGGHMRAHGLGDENWHMDDEDPGSDWDDKPGNKCMYALRANPNRLRSCGNCGKEFLSWKLLLEHGKCSLEDVGSFVPLSEMDDESGAGGWPRGKRSKRFKVGNCPWSEEEDLANCLVMLSSARVDPMVAKMEESCDSASKEEEPMGAVAPFANRVSSNKAKGVISKGMFECKACKKVFNSHQALGGHRASHKKVKGCFAAKLDDLDESLVEEDVITHDEFSKSTSIVPYDHGLHSPLMAFPSKRKSKVHECSICHRIFASGQALGGHKRCHWVTSNSPDTSLLAKFHQFQDHSQRLHERPKFMNQSEPLDLNVPARVHGIAGVRREGTAENPLSLQVSTTISLQPWIGLQREGSKTTTSNNINVSMPNVDDEAESKVKLAKLSDLKDMNLGGGSSPWLQVGIGSTTNGVSDPYGLRIKY